MNRRGSIGERGERLAEAELARRGYAVIERNFRTRSGELDLILSLGQTIVFCEVRSRVAGGRPGAPGGPLESIGPAKRRRLRLLAREWLNERAPAAVGRGGTLRFDAVGVLLRADGSLAAFEHVENAF